MNRNIKGPLSLAQRRALSVASTSFQQALVRRGALASAGPYMSADGRLIRCATVKELVELGFMDVIDANGGQIATLTDSGRAIAAAGERP